MLPSLASTGLGFFTVWRQVQLRFRRAPTHQPRQNLAACLTPVGESTGGFRCLARFVKSQDF